ncbi:MAG TPA: DUF222 domain-containing protein [Nocardioides sp.]|uniref:HNH endonuclease signature motif containing protein n=1 Tax=Nocardioides sp. TaxID=35761 RepID=UPI002CC38703|nr:DUF222 domain-containing protein [Nocardioides sp.]HQR27736.1 DUF222 domain-containing protein [Nocardioides sp.]
MSVQQLHQPRVAGLVAVAQEQVRSAASVPAGTVRTPELGEAIQRLAELESQAAALRLALSAEADARQVAHTTGDTGTDAWLAQLTGDTRAVMAGGLWLARLLQEKYAATREAFAAGQLRLDQVRVIVSAAEKAPAGAAARQLRDAEELLVAKATGAATRSGRPIDARRLRQLARRMFETISPELADQHESDQLRTEEHAAARETWFVLADNGDGTWSGRFVIPELHGTLLQHALDRLSAPRRLSRTTGGESVEDESLPGQGSLNVSERHGAALCELVEHLPRAGHTGTTTEIVVTMRLEALLSQVGAARISSGIHLSAQQARRLACESALIPLVLGGPSEPLDLGRARRLHTRGQRRALAAIHDSCAIAGCDRPFAWCEIHHHQLAWARGGHTDLDNALPLCWWHHTRAHDDGFDLRRHPSGDWRFHRRS